MSRLLAILIAAALFACSPPAQSGAAAHAPISNTALHVVGFSGDGERSAIVVQNADNTLTQCFWDAGQLSHCANAPAPGGSVAGYTATGSGDRSTTGDAAEVLVRAADGGLTQCTLAHGALSPCAPLSHLDGVVVAYEYFADAPSIVLQQGASLRECSISAGRLGACNALPVMPGNVVGHTAAGEDETAFLLARSDGSYEQCFAGDARLAECTTFASPGEHVVGYDWRQSGAALLLQRDDGALRHCILADSGLTACQAMPAWPHAR